MNWYVKASEVGTLVTFQCPTCQHSYKVRRAAPKGEFKCDECGTSFVPHLAWDKGNPETEQPR